MHSFFRYIHDIDMQILEWIAYLRNDILDQFMMFITFIGDSGLIWILLSLAFIATKRYRYVGLVSLLALILGALITDASLKIHIARNRPYTHILDYKLLIEEPSSYSFPSGHATSSFASAIVIAYYIKRLRYPILFFASLMAFTRMYLYVHFFSDIVAGILVGLASSVLAIVIAKKLTEEREEKQLK